MVRSKWFFAVCVYFLSAVGVAAAGLEYVETADGKRSIYTRNLIQWTHSRLVFNKDIERIAVGRSDFIELEVLGGREVLALAKNVGRTSVIVWYPDLTTETFLFSVIKDHSILQRALKEIHPSISIQLAPDRAALVLRGTVPTVKYKVAAEAAARVYLDADNAGEGNTGILMQSPADGGAAGDFRVSVSQDANRSTAAIINLIQVENQPATTAEKIEEALRDIGGEDVTVTRLLHGDVENDEVDTLLLKGKVQNQVALTRVLSVAARLFLDDGAEIAAEDSIEVVADESGALIIQRQNTDRNLGSGSSSLLGLQNSARLENEIKANIGRAKMLSVAGGRILSIIEVRDLPQVRVAVQIHEINRSRLKNWRPDLTLVSGDYLNNSFSPQGTGLIVQPDPSQRIGGTPGLGTQLENALQILGGALSNHLQIGTTELAFDLLFSLMEKENISRTLSRPTLTVLSGEFATFQVGGEIPVPRAFAPALGGGRDNESGFGAGGVFSGTDFKPFGVQLTIRPLVGEDDRITLDVNPVISLPDPILTREIAQSTGSTLNTAVFNTRSLRTTTRLRDGQPMVIAGLVTRQIVNNQTYTPKLHNVPLVGALTESSTKGDQDLELVIIVTPTIVREPMKNMALWQFSPSHELLASFVGEPDLSRLPQSLDPRPWKKRNE